MHSSWVKKTKWLEEQIMPVSLHFYAIAMANVVSKDSEWCFRFIYEEKSVRICRIKKNPYCFSNYKIDSF